MPTPSQQHQFESETQHFCGDFDNGFVVTTVNAPNMSVSRFDREGRNHTTISLHNVSDLNIDMDDRFGPTLTMNVGGERVTINLFNAAVAA